MNLNQRTQDHYNLVWNEEKQLGHYDRVCKKYKSNGYNLIAENISNDLLFLFCKKIDKIYLHKNKIVSTKKMIELWFFFTC